MTKVKTVAEGWAYVVIVKDWYSKKIVGHFTGSKSKSKDWQIAVEIAVNRQCRNGSRGQNISLMSDNGCQPTSNSFMAFCKNLGIKQAFTCYNNPKGNADTERVIRTMKEEVVYPREHMTIAEVGRAVDEWVVFYNRVYPHSAIGYRSPEQFEKEFFNRQKIPLIAA
jgi:putative transposase